MFLQRINEDSNAEAVEEAKHEEAEVRVDDGHCARSRPRRNTLFKSLDGMEASASTPTIGHGNWILREIESFKTIGQPVRNETEYLEEVSEEADEPIGGAEKKDNRDPDDDQAPAGGAAIAGGHSPNDAPAEETGAGECDDHNTDS